MSEPSSSNNSDLSYNSDYRRKRRRRKSDWKNDPIKLCALLTAKLLTTSYLKLFIKFNMDEDPLQQRIYFIIFLESLGMTFFQYKETCEVLLDYQKMGGKHIKEFETNVIRNFLHANIDVHGRRVIAELPIDGIKFIEKLQSHCANMTFSEKVYMTGFFNKSYKKEGNMK